MSDRRFMSSMIHGVVLEILEAGLRRTLEGSP